MAIDIPQKSIDRFWKRVDKKGENDCWLWMGYSNKNGYSSVILSSNRLYVHQASYIIEYGSLPSGQIHHSCENKNCVNPKHLYEYIPEDELLERFEKYFTKHGIESCWQWTGSKYPNGYGKFGVNNKQYGAHRIAYSLYVGNLSEELVVMHSCDNPCCVNPNHLTLSTQKDNMKDKINKNRQAKGEKHGTAIIDREKVSEIRAIYSEGNLTQRQIAYKYGLSFAHVNLIVKNRIWRDV